MFLSQYLLNNSGLRFSLKRSLILSILILFTINLPAQNSYVPGDILVQFRNGVEVNALQDWYNTTYHQEYSEIGQRLLTKRMNIWLFSFNETMNEEELLFGILKHDEVLTAQYNYYVELRDTIPNDARFDDQWDMQNTGQSGGTAGADVSAPAAWDIATGGVTVDGDTIVVAVIDGGFDLSHEDLDYFKNRDEIPNNQIDDDNNGYVDDYDGWNAYQSNGDVSTSGSHGTHVAGTVGAIGNNSVGIAGVNWNVKIMPISGSSNNQATVVEAYGYALEMRARYNDSGGSEGAFVVATNSSFGVDYGQPDNYPLWCNFYDSLGAYGILSAGATINSSVDVDAVGDIPTACASDWLFSVTNSTDTDVKRSGAGYGLTTIDLAAPGTSVLSTEPGDTYGTKTGTSMATPHVAGAIALMYSSACTQMIQDAKTDPSGVALMIKHFLLRGVDTLNSFNNLVVTHGRLNLHKALLELNGYACASCITISLNPSAASCIDVNDGNINLTVSGGTPPYRYSWSSGASTRDADSLFAGHYVVTVWDDAGCSVTDYTYVDVLSLELNGIVTNVSCFDENDGIVELTLTGGNPPFSYNWSTGDTTNMPQNLPPGSHTVTVTDVNGCEIEETYTITEPGKLFLAQNSTPATPGNSDGTATVLVFGGTPPFNYTWDDPANQTDSVATGLSKGTYNIIVTDANGCSVTKSVEITSTDGIQRPQISDISIYPNPVNDRLRVILGSSHATHVILINSLGQEVYYISLNGEKQTDLDVSELPAGIYLLKIIESQSTLFVESVIVEH